MRAGKFRAGMIPQRSVRAVQTHASVTCFQTIHHFTQSHTTTTAAAATTTTTSTSSSIHSSIHSQPFGVHLQVAGAFQALLRTPTPEIEEAVVNLGTLGVLMDMFKALPDNNLLHAHVCDIVESIVKFPSDGASL
jgi:hypothetical protein